MGRRPRKLEELADREAVILKAANHLMSQHGYQGFTMSDVAKHIDYAKGTLYLHFESKEDMAAAISAKNITLRAELLEMAASQPRPSRERFMALMLAEQRFYELAPEHFTWDHMLRQPSFWNKVSQKQKDAHSYATRRCLDCIESVVKQAVEDGDLELSKARIRPVVLMLVSLALGQTLVTSAGELRSYAQIPDSPQLLEEGLLTLLDGLQWHPVGSEFQWKKLRVAMLRQLTSQFAVTNQTIQTSNN